MWHVNFHLWSHMWKVMWKHTREMSHMKIHMWNFPCAVTWLHMGNFTCEFSHGTARVKFHKWLFTWEIPCENSHVKFHMWITWSLTYEISHVKFHMYFTCEISHVKFHMWFTCEISHVKFHMWFTCEISHVKFHMWKYMCFTCLFTCEVPITHGKLTYSRVFHMGFTCVSHAFPQEFHMCFTCVSHTYFCKGMRTRIIVVAHASITVANALAVVKWILIESRLFSPGWISISNDACHVVYCTTCTYQTQTYRTNLMLITREDWTRSWIEIDVSRIRIRQPLIYSGFVAKNIDFSQQNLKLLNRENKLYVGVCVMLHINKRTECEPSAVGKNRDQREHYRCQIHAIAATTSCHIGATDDRNTAWIKLLKLRCKLPIRQRNT